MKAILDLIPDPEHTNIGIITYNTSVQFFTNSLSGSGEAATVFMSDVMTPFAALPYSKALFNLKQNKAQIELILDKVATFDTTAKQRHHLGGNGSCGGAAVRAAAEILKNNAGKILWFLMDIPSLGFGSLKVRNNPTIANSEKQRILYNPDDTNLAYTDLSEFCLRNRIAVDIFACVQNEIDLASLMTISSRLGGEIYYYPQFNSAEYGEKLHFDLFRDMTRNTVYDISMRARCSTGLTVSSYVGGFGEITDPTVDISVMDADKTIGFLIRQDSKLKPNTQAYLQFAVLFTTIAGEEK